MSRPHNAFWLFRAPSSLPSAYAAVSACLPPGGGDLSVSDSLIRCMRPIVHSFGLARGQVERPRLYRIPHACEARPDCGLYCTQTIESTPAARIPGRHRTRDMSISPTHTRCICWYVVADMIRYTLTQPQDYVFMIRLRDPPNDAYAQVRAHLSDAVSSH